MTGKLLNAGAKPAHFTTRTGPRSSIVSPMQKWYTTRIARYPIDTKATKLVYFKESSRRRYESGMMNNLCSSARSTSFQAQDQTHMNAVIQKRRSTKKALSGGPPKNASTTPGMRSPMMMR